MPNVNIDFVHVLIIDNQNNEIVLDERIRCNARVAEHGNSATTVAEEDVEQVLHRWLLKSGHERAFTEFWQQDLGYNSDPYYPGYQLVITHSLEDFISHRLGRRYNYFHFLDRIQVEMDVH